MLIVRTRTVGSRKPPPTSTHLLKGDPDSATSPSKYLPLVAITPGQELSPIPLEPAAALVPPLDFTMVGSSSSEEDVDEESDGGTGRRRRLRRRKSRRDMFDNRRPAGSAKGGNIGATRDANRSQALNSETTVRPAAGRQGRPAAAEQEAGLARKKKQQSQAKEATKEEQKKRGKQNLTLFDLKDFLSKRKIVDNNFDMDIVMKQVKRLQREEEDVDEVEGSLTSASTIHSRPADPQQQQQQKLANKKSRGAAAAKRNFQSLVKLAVNKGRFLNLICSLNIRKLKYSSIGL
jgi:hypothetical protein